MQFLKSVLKPQVPKTKSGKFLAFFVGEIISSILITADYRAIAIVSYKWTGIINLFFFTLNIWFLRAFMKSDKDSEETFWTDLGYVIGGIAGAELGLWITVHLYGR